MWPCHELGRVAGTMLALRNEVWSMSTGDPASQAARARLQAEHRAIVQATMQAKRSGKLPERKSQSGAETLTALFVIVTVIGLLGLALKYGN